MGMGILAEYIYRCCISYTEARKVKKEIYSKYKDQDIADRKWNKIIHIVIEFKRPLWYWMDKSERMELYCKELKGEKNG